jgi:hypothetical protein
MQSLSGGSLPNLLVVLAVAALTMPLIATSATFITVDDPTGTLAPGPQQPTGDSDYANGTEIYVTTTNYGSGFYNSVYKVAHVETWDGIWWVSDSINLQGPGYWNVVAQRDGLHGSQGGSVRAP